MVMITRLYENHFSNLVYRNVSVVILRPKQDVTESETDLS